MSQKVIIIGAPRSGTNMLRNVLTRLPGMETWPCDEINYIWRHGNALYPSDEFPLKFARPEVVHYIRGQFDKFFHSSNCQYVVEKTCANSLRVDFVDAILPDAKYLFIYRDGLDVVSSAMKRWKAELDIPYLFAKIRFVPVPDLPFYGLHYLWNRMHRLLSRDKRLAYWGPRLTGMDPLLSQYDLSEICALQWQRCVESAQQSFDSMPAGKVVQVRYEDFVKDGPEELARICDFLGRSGSKELIKKALCGVSAQSVGKGHNELGAERLSRILPLIGKTLERYGYL